jgi:hypothetical protein
MRGTMTRPSTTFEESSVKEQVAHSEDIERDSTVNVVHVANMERVDITEEDVSIFSTRLVLI